MLRTLTVVVLVVLALPCASHAQDTEPPSLTTERWPGVTMPNPQARAAVYASLDRAVKWLSTTTCQAVLTEFRDKQGCPLADKLAAIGTTFDGHLGWILIRDGSNTLQCRNAFTIAFTSPGSRVVFVCGTKFHKTWRIDPELATAALIHEALHTLGLGEDRRRAADKDRPFPTSGEITSRVLALCGPE